MQRPDHRFAWTADGTRLSALAWPGDPAGPVLLGLPGLTRNARDFAPLAQVLGGRWPLVAASLRGRGLSAWAADPMTYAPPAYVADIMALLDALGLDRVVLVGTSLGALVGLGLAAAAPGRLAGLALNDLGPDLPEAGIARVQAQVVDGPGWQEGRASLPEAAAALKARDGAIYPAWSDADWRAHAARLTVTLPSGRVRFDCDPAIAAPFGEAPAGAAVDLWALFDRVAGAVPLLSIRGETSDILEARCQQRMRERAPAMQAATVPGVGHAPLLDEPESVAAIRAFLEHLG